MMCEHRTIKEIIAVGDGEEPAVLAECVACHEPVEVTCNQVFDRRSSERSMPKESRTVVECDENCGAFEEPETLEEFRDTLDHYKHHKFLDGCAHG